MHEDDAVGSGHGTVVAFPPCVGVVDAEGNDPEVAVGTWIREVRNRQAGVASGNEDAVMAIRAVVTHSGLSSLPTAEVAADRQRPRAYFHRVAWMASTPVVDSMARAHPDLDGDTAVSDTERELQQLFSALLSSSFLRQKEGPFQGLSALIRLWVGRTSPYHRE